MILFKNLNNDLPKSFNKVEFKDTNIAKERIFCPLKVINVFKDL